MVELDEIDYGILQLLQRDARNTTPVDMADQLPVSAQTIRNRISGLQDNDVIEGYVPIINYENAGFPIRLRFVCTAPVKERSDLATEALEISNVVHVQEILSGKENLHVVAVTNSSEEITEIAESLSELGLRLESERLMGKSHHRPFNHFGTDIVDEQ
ncbi:Lrp/AsnC family transcriptional regulator [Halosimplex aquaticum]|uniref:Lrp/AsnC family transcriptional regulator n=1 Tax=Halosimplex aquaticum TaxID=3026162 RepID=A0ABD5XW73_9EURY|nr:Lrp/AsnC family transcriptional regulator [Halosimplex aquaticum]